MDNKETKASVALGMVELPDHSFIVYVLNISPDPVDEVQVISRGQFFEEGSPPLITTESEIRRLGTIPPGEAVELERRDVGDLEFWAAYKIRLIRRNQRENYDIGTPTYNLLRRRITDHPALKTTAYLFTAG